MPTSIAMLRTRWAAIGAAVAVTLGAGGLAGVGAAQPAEDRNVFVPITPCRLVDTRPGSTVGPRDRPLGASDTHTVTARGTTGDCTIPSDAVALSLNVTAIGASAPTFLTVWPDGVDRPEASSLNPQPGQPPTPNAVTTELSSSGRFSMFNLQGVVDVLVDVNGYYTTHDHDDRYDTKAQVDDKIAAAVSTVTLGQGTDWVSNAGNPSTVGISESSAGIDGGPTGGTAHLSLVGPAEIGGVTYELSSVRYCLVGATGVVDEASIIGIGNGEAGDPLELGVETKDTTVRDSAGCFEITPDADTASRRTHHLMLFVIDDVQIGEVTATWQAI